ncbi:MAG: LytTR family transcriptional regulator [Bacteroidales bacterium]|nr:LytTR family transcriptional regulator [Clostridium sp.]MCM1204712.1 LytTR family transcriptional regulator [Bacteroidales bacterium]
MEEHNAKDEDILAKRSSGMNILVCTKNEALVEEMQKKENEDIAIFISRDLNVQIPEYDLVIVDMELCSGKLDIARLQSSRTVFILKDVDEHIDKLISDFWIGERLFRYRINGEELAVDLNDIIYFESNHRIITAYRDNDEPIRFYRKLDDVQREVDDYIFFLRVNQSCLVNYNYCAIKNDEVTVRKRKLQVSRTYKKAFKNRLKIIKNM